MQKKYNEIQIDVSFMHLSHLALSDLAHYVTASITYFDYTATISTPIITGVYKLITAITYVGPSQFKNYNLRGICTYVYLWPVFLYRIREL